MKITINSVVGREIIDSRGNLPEATVGLTDRTFANAAVPSEYQQVLMKLLNCVTAVIDLTARE